MPIPPGTISPMASPRTPARRSHRGMLAFDRSRRCSAPGCSFHPFLGANLCDRHTRQLQGHAPPLSQRRVPGKPELRAGPLSCVVPERGAPAERRTPPRAERGAGRRGARVSKVRGRWRSRRSHWRRKQASQTAYRRACPWTCGSSCACAACARRRGRLPPARPAAAAAGERARRAGQRDARRRGVAERAQDLPQPAHVHGGARGPGRRLRQRTIPAQRVDAPADARGDRPVPAPPHACRRRPPRRLWCSTRRLTARAAWPRARLPRPRRWLPSARRLPAPPLRAMDPKDVAMLEKLKSRGWTATALQAGASLKPKSSTPSTVGFRFSATL